MGRPKRHEEVYDSPEALKRKCKRLAKALKNARFPVIYTGAGISTAASIPDYRGPEGVWTMSSRGLPIRGCNPSAAVPTITHMALREMYTQGLIRHIVSQNCDGLHLRSGIPQKVLSEVHGNMYIEVCTNCDPLRQYIRKFDVTSATRFRCHKTGRKCELCSHGLVDTIVHFGERGKVAWPLNWDGAVDCASRTDLILCLGTSLQILKKYTFLWSNNRPRSQPKPKLFIVNLQWTPKDRIATEKIHGRCDEVMEMLMNELGYNIPQYCRVCDPVLNPSRRNTQNYRIMNEVSRCRCNTTLIATSVHSTSPLPSTSSTIGSSMILLEENLPNLPACNIESNEPKIFENLSTESQNLVHRNETNDELPFLDSASSSTSFSLTSAVADDSSCNANNNGNFLSNSNKIGHEEGTFCHEDATSCLQASSSLVSTSTACAALEEQDKISAKEAKRQLRLQKLLRNLETWDKYRRGAVVDECVSNYAVSTVVNSTPSTPIAADPKELQTLLPGWWSSGLSVAKRKKKPTAAGKNTKRRKISSTSNSSSISSVPQDGAQCD